MASSKKLLAYWKSRRLMWIMCMLKRQATPDLFIGYIARKTVLKSGCRDCFDEPLVAPQDASKDLATLAHFCDNGGLLYPSEQLFAFVEADDLHDMVQL
ncbi:hypothetical protein HPB50_013900 [Hyalomma asiaticum]|uniref:Uncharacterized protein n=1 Tax=Hyalomma asiaticum TaxID=266040 RepID=A0ACB7TK84_HYAAI|nr:hypothetical protein HPB50_013900 [Hyalomma asiaticum]